MNNTTKEDKQLKLTFNDTEINFIYDSFSRDEDVQLAQKVRRGEAKLQLMMELLNKVEDHNAKVKID